mgnify:CR=1 FL=1
MKHVLITGGSRGIGAEAVRAFAKEGYAVSFFYHKTSFSFFHCFVGKYCSKQSASDNKIVVFLHKIPFAPFGATLAHTK